MKNNYHEAINLNNQKLKIIFRSLLIGIIAGSVVTCYRIGVAAAEDLSYSIYDFLRQSMEWLPVWFSVLAVLGFFIYFLISRFKMTGGSGILQVKGIIRGYFEDNWLATLLVKFFGGILSIVAGLSLGRAGPSIQLGACVGNGIGNALAKTRTEKKHLMAGGASAGLSAAFSAPLSGVMFALEEIYGYVSPVVLLSTIVSAVAADYVVGLVIGFQPIFSFRVLETMPANYYGWLLAIGALTGLCGAFYNAFIITTIPLYKKVLSNAKARTVVPFLVAGFVGIYFPVILGSGQRIIDFLIPSTPLDLLVMMLIGKFLFSILSFHSNAPGGIFFPMLVMGATLGTIFANVSVNFLGADEVFFNNFIVLAMTGFFTAIVKAPITGIVMLAEMSGSLSHLLPSTIVAITAYTVASLAKTAPIYESLLSNMLLANRKEKMHVHHSEKTLIEFVVHNDAHAEDKAIKDIILPKDCLLIAIHRDGSDIIPRGDTVIKANDTLTVVCNANNEAAIRHKMDKILTVK